MAEEKIELKFEDYSVIFSFLYECLKNGTLTASEREKIKADFIAQNENIVGIFNESKTENHQNLHSRLKTYLFAKALHKKVTHEEEPILNETLSEKHSTKLSQPILNKFFDHPIEHSIGEHAKSLYDKTETISHQNFSKFNPKNKDEEENVCRKQHRWATQVPDFAGIRLIVLILFN